MSLKEISGRVINEHLKYIDIAYVTERRSNSQMVKKGLTYEEYVKWIDERYKKHRKIQNEYLKYEEDLQIKNDKAKDFMNYIRDMETKWKNSPIFILLLFLKIFFLKFPTVFFDKNFYPVFKLLKILLAHIS